MNDKSWHSLRILNDGRSALSEEKNQSVQWNTHFTREISVDCSRFLTVHNNNNDVTTCI